ncbi:MAG TPA: sigma-70 family RNA polymerase sigma factor [Pirellulales bacterium]|jgi:RNA polymerase sigma-70 factor (ECF subfamily)|nr:sigma-70 family RNA polymerase sigma factor [Pirellulales bacterium]
MNDSATDSSSQGVSSSQGGRSSLGTSATLIGRVKGDDPAAWDRLVKLYGPLVEQWCRRWGLQSHDVADVVQEVFKSVSAHVGEFRKQRSHDTFRGWLRVIVRHKVVDHFRRLSREPAGAGGSEAQRRLADIAAAPVDDSADDPSEEVLLFHRALDLIRQDFAERTWQAFWRTAVDGVPAPDVAAELGMTSGAVRVAKSRVLQRLRAELGDLSDPG